MPQVRVQLMHSPGYLIDLDPWTGLPGGEVQLPGPANQAAQFLDFGLVSTPSAKKTIIVVVDQALTTAAAQQATVQLFAARSIFSTAGSTPAPNVAGTLASGAFLGGSGAASTFPTTGLNACQARGPVANFGGNAASRPAGVYFFDFDDMPKLEAQYAVIGIEITAGAAFTGGSCRVFVQFASV